MDIKKMQELAIEVKDTYRERGKLGGEMPWTVSEYMAGFVGDVGALSKLIMVKQGYREGTDIVNKIPHELADCLWSILVIANELEIDLEEAFLRTLRQLNQGISEAPLKRGPE